MAKKPETKISAAPNVTKAAAPDSAAPKAEAPATETAAPSETAAPAKKASGPSRPISYFSSVSTDEYRSGWSNIFGNANGEPAPETAAAKRPSKLPVTLELDLDGLDAVAREHLEALFRLQAKKKRLNYDKLAENNQVTLRISCHISQ